MPAHVALAKDVKKLIDEASSVFITSDNEDEEEKQPPREECQPPRPPPGSPGTPCVLMQSISSKAQSARRAESSHDCDESSSASQDSTSADNFDGYASTGTLPPFSLSDDDGQSVDDMCGLDEEIKSTAKSVAKSTDKEAPKPGANAVSKVAFKFAKARTSVGVNKNKKPKQTSAPMATPAQSSGTKTSTAADARERLRYPKLSDTSDRLGGVNLAEMRDAMKKRPYDELEEASYTKQKRLKAEKAAAELKRKLNSVDQTAAGSGTDLIKTIMVLRADAERVDMERRREERRVNREAMEERRREDRREARQHMQDMLLMLSSLKNGTIPSVSL